MPLRTARTDPRNRRPAGWRSSVRAALCALAALLAAGALRAAPQPDGIPLPAPPSAVDFRPVDMDRARLGQLLFWDPILSGNRNISCGTCHHPRFGTSDGLALGVGEGGIGLGPERRVDPDNPPEERVPRNSPALFNLGAREFATLFHDGRIETDPARASGLRTPLEDEMTLGFDNVLSAQTMFPVLSQDEMAGHYSENDVSRAVRMGRLTGPDGAWDLLARRVDAIPDYRRRFAEAFPEIAAGAPIAFTDISNAIAEFIAFEWRSTDSPFDAHLSGAAPLRGAALEGMALFYGAAGCAVCHSGPFLTDQGFHAMGEVQIGPGKRARFESHRRDDGRIRVTGRAEDAFRFRTPSLRNVTRTGPYGHAGATAELRAYLRRHADPAASAAIDGPLPAGVGAGEDHALWETRSERDAVLGARGDDIRPLAEPQIDLLLAFLESLSDPLALSGRLGIPHSVPSGLPVDR
ncbi:cytochrome-c peroxidase [Profundibacterium mesophilum]|uniref:Cytochrome c peroxidase n=1 Tax=Profundibacterium mesophilum KAUST100406-0324 TaxID=1037889 RepID=A0A921TCD3_9RHOB|nr:cytochrome c peroxidase [Profundibacterium mesophilum]KAF0676965.1 Cytochrome c peroxidase [Profundibacterium mesophilum KAUST100406-0324]